MKRARVLTMGAAALAAAALVLTGCGGSGGGGDKEALVNELMSEIEQDGSITQEQKACLRGKFESFSGDELALMKNSENQEDIPAELQDRLVNAITECVMVGMETTAP